MKKKNFKMVFVLLLILVCMFSAMLVCGCVNGKRSINIQTNNAFNASIKTEVNGIESYYAYKGDVVKVVVTVNSGYVLKSGSLKYNDTVINETTLSFIMPDHNVVLKAEFIKVFDITINPTTNGTIQTNVDQAQAGQSVSVIVTPADGYILKLDSLKFNNMPIDEELLRFDMPEENIIITAEFVEPLVFNYLSFTSIVRNSEAGIEALYIEFKFNVTNNTSQDIIIYPDNFHSIREYAQTSSGIWIKNGPYPSLDNEISIKILSKTTSTVYFFVRQGPPIAGIKNDKISSINYKLFYDINGSLLLCSVDVNTSMYL